MKNFVNSTLFCAAIVSMIACGSKDLSKSKGEVTAPEQKTEQTKQPKQDQKTEDQTKKSDQIGDQTGDQAGNQSGDQKAEPKKDQEDEKKPDQGQVKPDQTKADQTKPGQDQNGQNQQGQLPSQVEIENFKITSVKGDGSGCKNDPIGSIASDGQSFELKFDSFTATEEDSRKDCQVMVKMDVPQGWSYSVFKVAYSGYVNLEDGVTAEQASGYYFSGNREAESKVESLKMGSDFNGDFVITDEYSISSITWSPCGERDRTLQIKTTIEIDDNGTGKSGEIGIKSIDGTLEQKYSLRWKKCK